MGAYPLMGSQDSDGVLAPINLECSICEPPENVENNVKATLGRKYTNFWNQMASRKGVVSICGSGPSITDCYRDIVGNVMACNAAHDFLVGKDIIPDYTMFFDAAEIMQNMIVPTNGVTYLVASRCHPKLFERLEGHNVVVWHAGGDECIQPILEERNINEPIVNGGSAAVTRALFVAWAMGWTEMHLFGADSSYRANESHYRKSLVEEQPLEVWACGKWFRTTPWLAQQVEDFKILAPALRDAGGKIVIHGEGLLPHVAKELGFTVHPLTT